MNRSRILFGQLKSRAYEIVFGGNVPSNPYKRDQDLFVLEGMSANVFVQTTTGVYLTGYALLLGVPPYIVGLLYALPQLTNVLQMVVAPLYEKLPRRKPLMVLFNVLYRTLMVGVILIPLLLPKPAWPVAMVVMVLLGNAAYSLYLPGVNNWTLSLVPPELRARYFPMRESGLQFVAMIVSLSVGVLTDAVGGGYAGFATAYGIAAAAVACNIYLTARIREPKSPHPPMRMRLSRLLKIPLVDKRFVRLVLFYSIYNFGMWMSMPYESIYMKQHLHLSFGVIALQNAVYLLSFVLTIRIWGRVARARSWKYALTCCCAVYTLRVAVWSLVGPGTWWLVFPNALIAGVGYGGLNIGILNAVAEEAQDDCRTVYLSLQAAVTGISSFSGPLLAGGAIALLERLAAAWAVPGVSGMQLFFLFSSLLMLAGTLLLFGLMRAYARPQASAARRAA
nr:MFS transporter [Maliibacterium massiliense]